MEELTLEMTFSEGSGTMEVDASHPLVGAFSYAVETGKPPGRWAFLLVEDETNNGPFMAGTFIHTVGDRLLFSPGASIAISTGESSSRFEGKLLEHLTLDPPRTGDSHSSHVAVRGLPKKKSRGIGYTTIPPAEYKIPWFSMLVPGMHDFDRMPGKLIMRFPAPVPDLDRFGKQLLSTAGSVLIPLPPMSVAPNFVEFDVWAGRGPSWRELRTRPLAWAYKPEIVEAPPPDQQGICIVSVEVEFSPAVGLTVIASRPAGKLVQPRILRPTLAW